MSEKDENGWPEYKIAVLKQLEFLTTTVTKIDDTVNKIDKETAVEIALLKQKAGIWGGIVGLVVTLIAQGIFLFIKWKIN